MRFEQSQAGAHDLAGRAVSPFVHTGGDEAGEMRSEGDRVVFRHFRDSGGCDSTVIIGSGRPCRKALEFVDDGSFVEPLHPRRGLALDATPSEMMPPRQTVRARLGAWVDSARVQRIVIGLILLNRSEEHTSELQSLMRTSYAVFCLKKKKKKQQ